MKPTRESRKTLMCAMGLLMGTSAMADASGDDTTRNDLPPIIADTAVNLGIDEAWELWTTPEGLQTFFSRKASVDLRIDGTYDVLFFPDNPPGLRGAEGMRILAIEKPNRLLITWNSPAIYGDAAKQRAVVEYRFQPHPNGGTQVEVKHFGWGRSDVWRDIHAYFAGAWEVVLRRFAYSVSDGPVDWDNLPAHLVYSGPNSSD